MRDSYVDESAAAIRKLNGTITIAVATVVFLSILFLLSALIVLLVPHAI